MANTRRQYQRGAAMVEMALIVPFCMLLLAVMFDFCQFLNKHVIVSRLAYEGARIASTQTGIENTLGGSEALIRDKLQMLVERYGFSSDEMLISTSNTIATGHNTVKIDIMAPFNSMLGGVALTTVRASAEAPYLYPADGAAASAEN